MKVCMCALYYSTMSRNFSEFFENIFNFNPPPPPTLHPSSSVRFFRLVP